MIEINRYLQTKNYTIGILFLNGYFYGYSLERPWKENIPFESSIYPGTYKYEVYLSDKFKTPCIGLINVLDRQFICVHPGNSVEDTKGCILVGDILEFRKKDKNSWSTFKEGDPGKFDDVFPYIYNSKKTLSMLISIIPEKGVLTIK